MSSLMRQYFLSTIRQDENLRRGFFVERKPSMMPVRPVVMSASPWSRVRVFEKMVLGMFSWQSLFTHHAKERASSFFVRMSVLSPQQGQVSNLVDMATK